MPDFKQDFKNYERFDVGAIGEFDVSMLIDQYASEEESKRMYPSWRGRLLLFGVAQGQPIRPARIALCLALGECGEGGRVCSDLCEIADARYKQVKAMGENQQEDLSHLETLAGSTPGKRKTGWP